MQEEKVQQARLQETGQSKRKARKPIDAYEVEHQSERAGPFGYFDD